MSNARAFGEEWTTLENYMGSTYDVSDASDSIHQTEHYRAREDILEGLRYGLLYSAVLWFALIVGGLLVFGL
jgi:hypothetical protein